MTTSRSSRLFLILALPAVSLALGSPLQEISRLPLAALWIVLWTTAGGLRLPGGERSLGAGSAGVPLALAVLGPRSGVWLGALARLLASALYRLLRPGLERDGRGGPTLSSDLEDSGRVALAVAAGTLAWHLAANLGSPYRMALFAAAYLAALGALGLLPRPLTTLRQRARALLAELAPDAWGCAVGAVLAAAAPEKAALALLALFQLPVLEAAWQRSRDHRDRLQREEQKRVRRSGLRISSSLQQPEELARWIYSECRRALNPSFVHLEILDSELDTASFWFDEHGELREGHPSPPENPPKLPGIHRRAEWRVLYAALEVENDLVGRLHLWCDPRKLRRHSIELFDSLTPQMAQSLRSALLGRRASHDGLTGLALRRELETRLASAFSRRRREDRSHSVLMVDLDHFKTINDTYGHPAGDLTLVEVARVLQLHLREGDLAARYGGEEFALFLNGAPGEKALEIAERLRRRIESLSLDYESHRFSVTASIGAASVPELYVLTAQELLAVADEALYHAKTQGRNRCFLYRGKNRCLDPDGREHILGETRPSQAPRFFA